MTTVEDWAFAVRSVDMKRWNGIISRCDFAEVDNVIDSHLLLLVIEAWGGNAEIIVDQ